MNDIEVKAAVDRFLKQVSFTAHREIEKVMRNALASGRLQPGNSFNAAVTLSSEKINLDVTIFKKIEIE